MILSCSWIFLPCLSSSVIIRFFPRRCVLLICFKLLDASIVSRISSNLCFRISSLAFYGLTYLHIFYVVSGGVLFSIISLRFFIRALVCDDIFGCFCFLVCFARLIALCWIISVMFLFRLSMSSCSSSAVNLFSVRVETCSSSFQSFECQLSFVHSWLEASFFPLWCLEKWSPLPSCGPSSVDAVYDGHVGNHARFVSHDVVNFIFSVSVRASPCPPPPCFLLKLCLHDLEILRCCPFYKSVSSFMILTQAEAPCRPF